MAYEEEEQLGLVSHINGDDAAKKRKGVPKLTRFIQLRPWSFSVLVVVLFLLSTSVFWKDLSFAPSTRGVDVLMTCPSDAKFDDGNTREDHNQYDGASKQIMSNFSAYLEVFREADYDQWGKSYTKVKKLMTPWKNRVYADLASGSSIFESACGIGLNLFMTLEILAELNITDIVVYGNEYSAPSVQVARKVAEHLPANGRMGSICEGDSSNISFVPSDSFDLVYTGYITPLFDPLETGLSEQKAEDYNMEVCSGKNDSSVALQRKMRRTQEDWYASWALELIRIAKPGAWIVIEQVSHPLCEALFDWGGVEQAFWLRAPRFYDGFQHIDQDTIEFEDDLIFTRRYHVRFRKLNITTP